jgi:DNA-binding HxlR family transcriptional regulator
MSISQFSRKNAIIGCPLTAVQAVLGGKWKLLIVYWLAKQPHQFAELQRKLGAISHKVLSQQLRELVADGVLHRQRTGPVPTPVIYSLTEYGRLALPLLEQARLWGNEHIARLRAQGTSRLAMPPVALHRER